MVPELQKPRVTEIQVRIDCNGCVQKIKKALHGINGICNLYIDFPQQKITIVGWADPEKIVKAIKKTRKSAIICSHTEPPDPPAQPSESPTQGEAPAPESANPPPTESAKPPPTESPPAEAAPTAEPSKDPPQQENPKPEAKPSPDSAEASASQPVQPSGPKDVEEVHVIYHHPPDYGYRYGYSHNIGHGYSGHWHSYPTGPGFRPEPPPTPVYVTHSYNTHRPAPYVTGYECVRTPPQYTHYNQLERQTEDYHHGTSGNRYQYVRLPPQYMHYNQLERQTEDYQQGTTGNGNVTAIFSDENPNACTIV